MTTAATTTLCRTCRANPVIAIGLCRRCGQRQADVERQRRHRAERRQHAATRIEHRQPQEAPAGWPEPKDTA